MAIEAGTVRPLKVLLVAPSMAIVGGQAVQAERLLAELRLVSSLEVSFLAIQPRLPGPLRLLQRVRYIRTVVTFVLYIPLVLAKVPRHEIIHVFSASYWSYALWSLPPLLVGRLFGKKVIVNYRSGEAEDHLTTWRSAVPTLRLAHKLAAPSDYLVGVFGRFGLRMRSIPNILTVEQFRYRARRRLRPVFLTNRMLDPLYNVGCVLRAFHIVQQHYPDASLTIAHDGVCRRQLEALAGELGLRNTRFIGRVPHEAMPELYDAADIYLTSPDLDCMPGSILECFASGLPVIATRAGGIPNIITDQETGLLVDCGDYEAMAACALRLLEDEELVVRLISGARLECRKYDGAAIREAWVALYYELTST
jgi:glycosyltransferase involved in cell wall biosynthesis